ETKKTSSFEIFLKRQDYEYIPSAYTVRDKSVYHYAEAKGKLRDNDDVLFPVSLNYYNYEKNFRIEASYFKVDISSAKTFYQYPVGDYRTGSSVLALHESQFLPTVRSEAELNFLKLFKPGENSGFQLGAGVRNINKYQSYNTDYQFVDERIKTYGPQLVLKFSQNLTEKLSLNGGLDIFYAEGKRTYNYQFGIVNNLTDYSYNRIYGNPGTTGLFRGYEADLSLSYNVQPSVKLFVGYSYIYSFFSYRKDYGYYVYFSNNRNYFVNSIHPGSPEILRGFYLGASVSF
ncbi:MAG: LA_2444/LA_4059 family outer membrane protein, partial [Leptospira sp.]|nr:LA_2444/LA_4059 family outer membrane protein [Leptospira sp.]